MTIGDKLAEQAQVRPHTPALIDDIAQCTLTFSQLDDEVARSAAWWRRQGLQRGQAVLVFVPMSADLYVALLAIFRLGAVALFLDPSAGCEHLERCCSRWKPDALFAIPKAHLLRLTSRALRSIPLKVTTRGWIPGARRWLAHGDGERHPTNDAQPDDAALVTFTSGSTGVPKAAVRTQDFLLAQYKVLAPSIELESGDVDLATLPVFPLANLAAGVTTVIPDVDLKRPGAVDAGRIWSQIERHQVNRIAASPAFFERLIAHASGARTLPTLRKLHTGGAPVFPRLLQALQTLAPRAKIVAMYGSTEAEPIAHIAADELTDDDLRAMRSGQGLLAGTVVSGLRLRIVRDRWGEPLGSMSAAAFESERLAPGEVGEIVVTGDHVLKQYLGGIGEEETKFRVDGEIWHRTGDAGMFDDRGRLWLAGRCAARIDDERGRLYPFGVECVAMTFPAVKRAAFTVMDARRVLVIEAGASARLRSEIETATKWAQVDEVCFIHAMPVDKRHNAKIDYPALKAHLRRKKHLA